MIKQPYQILKWYNGNGEQEYYHLRERTNWQIPKYDNTIIPSFCIKRDARANNVTTWELRSIDESYSRNLLDTGVLIWQCYLDIRTQDMLYDYIVFTRAPIYTVLPEDRYYYKVSDGVETWYSEVFELCDFWETMLFNDSINNPIAPNWSTFAPTTQTNRLRIQALEAVGNGAQGYTNAIDVIYGEKLWTFIYESGVTKTGNCQVWLEDAATLDIISDVYTMEDTCNEFVFTPQKTCSARLRFNLPNGFTYSGYIQLWAMRWFIEEQIVLRWSDTENFCDMPYEDGWDNYIVIDGILHKESIVIEEENVEDDEKNLYPLIQTIQKWYKYSLASGVNFMEGLSMLRLHSTVTVTVDTGWEIIAMDVSLESTIHDDYTYAMALNFREDSCSKEACGFETECCCPTLEDVLDYKAGGLVTLPAAGVGTLGDRYLVLTGGSVYIYECEFDDPGYAWHRQTDEEIRNSCVLDLDTDASENNQHYWVYNPVTAEFQYMCELAAVAPVGGGIARFQAGDIISTDEFDCLVYIQAQRDDGGGWEDIDDPIPLETLHDAGTYDFTSPLGAADFRLRVYTHNCALHYTNEFNITVT